MSPASVPESAPPSPRGRLALLRLVGPGLVVAATGVGAGDLVAAAQSGATYGAVLLWTALAGALLKFFLAEGVGRWQLATSTTILEGWVREMGRPVGMLFLLYLCIWSFVVAAALMSACGLAAHALLPRLPVWLWAVAHAVTACIVVFVGEYRGFENSMKVIVGLMFLGLVGSAVVQHPPLEAIGAGLLVPRVPVGATLLALGSIGGVGGTVTLLSYGFWMREKGWVQPHWLSAVRVDLGVAYGLTGLFGIAVMSLAAQTLQPEQLAHGGRAGLLLLGAHLGERFGGAAELLFLAGFWAAVASSLLGVWQGVPYLFDQTWGLLRRLPSDASPARRRRSASYRGFLLFMTFPPMTLLLLERPVWLVIVYAALGALFMPFLAATLLVLGNRRRRMGRFVNGFMINAALLLCLLLFLYLMANDLRATWWG